MYSFSSMDHYSGTFADDGSQITFDNAVSLAAIQGFFPNGDLLIYSQDTNDLDKYLRGYLVQRYFRFDWKTGKKEELFKAWPDHKQVTALFILSDEQLLVAAGTAYEEQMMYLCDLDGNNKEQMWEKPAGYAYGMSFSPDRETLAYHLTGAGNEFNSPGCYYSINTLEIKSKKRKLIYEKPGHLMFGPVWSADGKYLLFQDCHAEVDRNHLFSDIVYVSSDGSSVNYVTQDQASYFGTTFGLPEYRSGGSNCPIYTPDGRIIFARRSPGAHPDNDYDPSRGDHHENGYAPENARGGSWLVIYDPATKKEQDITRYQEGKWDFRASINKEKDGIVYTSVWNGKASQIHMCRMDGSDDKFITDGHDHKGADFGRWTAERNPDMIRAFRETFLKA